MIVIETVAEAQQEAGGERGIEFPVTEDRSHGVSIEQEWGGWSEVDHCRSWNFESDGDHLDGTSSME